MNERTKELIAYVELLTRLMDTGFKCEQELKQALEELHGQMIKKKATDLPVFILVLENHFGGVSKSYDTFTKLLNGANHSLSRVGDDITMTMGKRRISIMKVNSEQNARKLEGLSPDYIINNTDLDISKLGLRTK